MKKTASILLFAAFAAQLHAVQMASQPWVTNRIDAATNALERSQAEKIADALRDGTNYAATATAKLREDLEEGRQSVSIANNAHQAASLKDWVSGRSKSAGEIFAQIENAGLTTNDVCAIVTNEVSDWAISAPPEVTIRGDPEYYGVRENQEGTWWRIPVTAYGLSDYDWTIGSETDTTVHFGALNITATRFSRNALGLARFSDIPTNHVTKAELESAVGAIPTGATPQAVTNIVRAVSLGGIWDDALQVWWTPVMSNGSLTYQATTNVNLNAED